MRKLHSALALLCWRLCCWVEAQRDGYASMSHDWLVWDRRLRLAECRLMHHDAMVLMPE